MSEPPVSGPGQPSSEEPGIPPGPPSYGEQSPPPPPPPPSYADTPPPPPGQGQPGWASGPPPGTVGERPGELLDRFVARLIDHVLLGVVNAIIASVVLVGIIGLDGGSGLGMLGSTGGSFAASAAIAVLGVAIALGYFAFLDSTQGRTLGKMAMKLRVEGASGGKPTIEESLKRNVWIALGLAGIVPVLGFIGSLASLVVVILIAVGINKDTVARRPWTDTFAGTRVVKEG